MTIRSNFRANMARTSGGTMSDMELIAALPAAANRFDARVRAGNDSFAIGKADICRDLARRYNQYNRWASERQRSYAEALVRWSLSLTAGERRMAEAQQARADTRSAERTAQMSALTLQRIAQLFASAAVHGLRFPKIRLRRGEWKIIIYPAPRNGRHPGAYYVKATSATAHSLYCGRIIPAGDFVAHIDCPLDVIEALREFAADPARVASAYGLALGHCCFCGRNLTDSRSIAMGYGPVCAERFGLEWGEQRAPRMITIDNRGEITGSGGTGGEPRLARHSVATQQFLESVAAPRRPTPEPLRTPTDPDDEDSHFM